VLAQLISKTAGKQDYHYKQNMTEEQLAKIFCDKYIPTTNRVFRKISHNLN